MKKILFLLPFMIFYSCLWNSKSDDYMIIYNSTDSAIYVYLACGNPDSLPSSPALELFHYQAEETTDENGNTIKPHFLSPRYRMNPYSYTDRVLIIKEDSVQFPCDENEFTLFFLTEATLANYNWEEIFARQLFVKRVTFTREYFYRAGFHYTYKPLSV